MQFENPSCQRSNIRQFPDAMPNCYSPVEFINYKVAMLTKISFWYALWQIKCRFQVGILTPVAVISRAQHELHDQRKVCCAAAGCTRKTLHKHRAIFIQPPLAFVVDTQDTCAALGVFTDHLWLCNATGIILFQKYQSRNWGTEQPWHSFTFPYLFLANNWARRWLFWLLCFKCLSISKLFRHEIWLRVPAS